MPPDFTARTAVSIGESQDADDKATYEPSVLSSLERALNVTGVLFPRLPCSQVLSSFEFAPAVGCYIWVGSVMQCGAISAEQLRIAPRVDGLSELSWRQPAETGMWSAIIVDIAPA
jgi:hypothetical protein